MAGTNQSDEDTILSSMKGFEEAPAATTEIASLEESQKFWRLEQDLAQVRDQSEEIAESLETLVALQGSLRLIMWLLLGAVALGFGGVFYALLRSAS